MIDVENVKTEIGGRDAKTVEIGVRSGFGENALRHIFGAVRDDDEIEKRSRHVSFGPQRVLVFVEKKRAPMFGHVEGSIFPFIETRRPFDLVPDVDPVQDWIDKSSE